MSEPIEPAYVRSPITALRFGVSVVVTISLFLAARAAQPARFAVSFDDFLASAPHWLVSGGVGACQLGFLVPAFLGLFAQLTLRRFRRVGHMLFAATVCVGGLVVVSRLVGARALPLVRSPSSGDLSGVLDASGLSGYGIGALFPTTIELGAIAAAMHIDRSHWSERWRRVGLVILVLGIAARLGVSFAHPAAVLLTVATAATASLIVQLILGVPNTRPRGAMVGETLQRFGYQPSSVERIIGYRAFAAFSVGLDDGRQLFVRIVSRESWDALLPVRIYRAARFRDIGQDRPLRSLRTVVEYEALCALKAHSDGVPTAQLATVAEFGPDAMMLAFDATPIERFSRIDPSRRTPQLVADVWAIVATLQRNHMVHGRLNADSLLVDHDDNVLLVDFTSASLGVVGPSLSTDIAELLAATAARIGPERAVQAAVEGVGAATIAEALPRLQPLALTPATRSAIKAAGCLDELRDEVRRVTGAAGAPIAALERIKTRTVVAVTMAAVALWTLIPQIVGVGSVWGELRHANWWWATAALVLSAVTYVGAAVALDGSLPDQLPLAPNVGVQIATSFVGVAAPGGAIALTARFLQKRGIGAPAIAAAVGVDLTAGLIVHVTLTVLFFALAGTSGLRTFHLPSLPTIGVIAAAVVIISAISATVPWTRSLLSTRILPVARRSLAGVGDVARRSNKMIELFGGSLAITLGYLFALVASVAAFGGGPAFTSVAVVYLVGAGVSAIAPTPGGLGAVEATLIAGLTSAGMASTTAVASVILFRLATFWIPLIPGWAALTLLQRSGDL